jgi:hypothetical protein
LARTGEVHLAPDSNRKVLKAVDHESAIRLGSEDKHLIAIDPDFFSSRPTTAPSSATDRPADPAPPTVAEYTFDETFGASAGASGGTPAGFDDERVDEVRMTGEYVPAW